MRSLPAVLALLLFVSCASTPPPAIGRGTIAIQIIPNPIVATKISGETYEFPFEVLVRETGGRAVEITRISTEVYALGGTIRVASESYDAAEIRRLGYSPTVPANSELRYRFAPRRSVPDDRLFGGVSAELRVEARDDRGAHVTATTTVTVRR